MLLVKSFIGAPIEGRRLTAKVPPLPIRFFPLLPDPTVATSGMVRN